MRTAPALLVSLLLGTGLLAAAVAAPREKNGAKPEPAAKKAASKPESKKAASDKDDNQKPEAKPDAKKKPDTDGKTLTVKKGPIKIEVELDGHFAAQDAMEIMVRTKTWSDLEVQEALKHGARVNEGDVLVEFDTEKIDKVIADAQTEVRLGDLAVRAAAIEVELLESLTPINVALTDRNHKWEEQDYERFKEVDLPMTKKVTDFSLRMAKSWLDQEKEELRQLEKMYEADDLTEETEEIILRRQRLYVESAELQYEQAKLQHEEAMKMMIPRQVETRETGNRLEDLRYQQNKEALPLTLEKAKAELAKARLALDRSREKLDELKADRKALVVEAPGEGILYYGRAVDGKFTGSDGKPMLRGDKVPANQVFMTVVKPRPVKIVAAVPEDKLYAVRPGMQAKVKPKGYPDLKLSAVVAEVDGVPAGEGKFHARLTVTLDDEAEAVVPGMSCKATLVPYLKADALLVPEAAVQADPLDDAKHYVYVVKKDEEPKRQPVEIGKKAEKKVEILSGLKDGEEILKEVPKD